jgi:hypothetical protein
MKKGTILGVISAVAVWAVLFATFQYYQLTRAAGEFVGAKEIVNEKMTKEGINSTAHFVSAPIDAPVSKVRDAVWKVELSSKFIKNFKASDLVKAEGNKKTVKLQLQALNLPAQHFTMEFTLDATNNRVEFKTIESQAQDVTGWYQLEPVDGGKHTKMIYHSEAKDKINVPFPQSVIEGALRETFVNTVRGISNMVKGA